MGKGRRGEHMHAMLGSGAVVSICMLGSGAVAKVRELSRGPTTRSRSAQVPKSASREYRSAASAGKRVVVSTVAPARSSLRTVAYLTRGRRSEAIRGHQRAI